MRLVSTRVVADALAVTEHTVRQYARDGVIPFVRTPGGHRRYELAAVLDALATRPRAFEPIHHGIRLDPSDSPRALRVAHGWRDRFAVIGYRRDAEDEDDESAALTVAEEPPYLFGSAVYVAPRRSSLL